MRDALLPFCNVPLDMGAAHVLSYNGIHELIQLSSGARAFHLSRTLQRDDQDILKRSMCALGMSARRFVIINTMRIIRFAPIIILPIAVGVLVFLGGSYYILHQHFSFSNSTSSIENTGPGLSSSTTSARPLTVKNVQVVTQLIGDDIQLYVNGIYYKGANPSMTLTDAGVFGTAEGYPVHVGNQNIFFFGDTKAAYLGKDGKFYQYNGNHAADSIGYMPYEDLSNCNPIQGLITQMDEGNMHPTPDYSNCPTLSFYTNPNHTAKEPIFQPITINGLSGQEGTKGNETPVGTFAQNGYLYMFYGDIIQRTGQDNLSSYHLETILTKSAEPVADFSPSNPPVFQKLYVVSQHPPIADPANPPGELNGPGKFMRLTSVTFSQNDLAANGTLHSLPKPLQSAAQVMFLFGSSWENKSNLYLAAVDPSQIDVGTSTWWYLSGNNNGAVTWTGGDEATAIPLIPPAEKPSFGEHGVIWSDALHGFLMLHGEPANGITAQFSLLPWGPWSSEISVLSPTDTLATEIGRYNNNPIVSDYTQMYDAKTGEAVSSSNIGGTHLFGTYFVGPADINNDGSVTYYFTFSPFMPYETSIMKATFCVSTACRP